MKTQNIRLVDVYVIGPAMLYSAFVIPPKHVALRISMAVFGASTIIYNWRNYQCIEKGKRRLESY